MLELEAPPAAVEATSESPLVEEPEAESPPAAPAGPAAPLPPIVIAHLVSLALRTDQGRACWDCFVAGKVDAHPWLAAPPAEIAFLPGPGTLTPRVRPEAG